MNAAPEERMVQFQLKTATDTYAQVQLLSAVHRVNDVAVEPNEIPIGVVDRARRDLRELRSVDVQPAVHLSADAHDFRADVLSFAIAIRPDNENLRGARQLSAKVVSAQFSTRTHFRVASMSRMFGGTAL